MRRTFRILLLLLFILAVLMWPADARAQYYRPYYRPHYHPSVFFGFGFGFGVGPYYPYYPFYYRPYYYSPFYPPWYGWYPYGVYGGYYPPYPPYGWYDDTSAARIQVKPRNAEVFIDGHFVGLVDDFDGWAQRLHVVRGEHELAVYLDGYRTFRQKVLFRPGATVTIEAQLQPLASGEPAEARPAPVEGAGPDNRPAPPERLREGGRQGPPGGGRPVPAPRREREQAPYGAIAVRVQPVDAEVIVDGERWHVPEGSEQIVIQLSEGEHRLEIRKEGYRTYSTTVRVARGDTVPLNVSLTKMQVAKAN